PTKTIMVTQRERDAQYQRLYDLSFAKRPAIELYDLQKDPHQLVNVAGTARYTEVQTRLTGQLMEQLERSGDPRAKGGGQDFDQYPYLGGAPKIPAALRR
ncbi:MAG: DUF4976 domain-containing protein, partial [Pirellulales bacterium]|nr:DUF4976 domain-containing protein [Pirellulales bacterium]